MERIITASHSPIKSAVKEAMPYPSGGMDHLKYNA